MAQALPCPFDLAFAQPRLAGCPPDDSFLMFISPSGSIPQGIAFASWSLVKQCLGGQVAEGFLQFVIGEPNSPMNQGDTTLVVTQPNVIVDSVWITLGSQELPRNRNDQVSYNVTYQDPAVNKFTVAFNQQAIDEQLYIVHYLYLNAVSTPSVLPLIAINFRVGDGGPNTPSAGSNIYNPTINPLIGHTPIMVFQSGGLIPPSPTEVGPETYWTWDGVTQLALVNGEFDNDTSYTIIYQ